MCLVYLCVVNTYGVLCVRARACMRARAKEGGEKKVLLQLYASLGGGASLLTHVGVLD